MFGWFTGLKLIWQIVVIVAVVAFIGFPTYFAYRFVDGLVTDLSQAKADLANYKTAKDLQDKTIASMKASYTDLVDKLDDIQKTVDDINDEYAKNAAEGDALRETLTKIPERTNDKAGSVLDGYNITIRMLNNATALTGVDRASGTTKAKGVPPATTPAPKAGGNTR